MFETNYLEELNLKEVEFISLFKSYEHSIGYNIALGGGGTLGVSYKNPNAAKYLIEYVKKYGNPIYKTENRKMHSERMKGNKLFQGMKTSDENKEKSRVRMLGTHHSDESRVKMSQSAKNRVVQGMSGKEHSEETRKKLSLSFRKKSIFIRSLKILKRHIIRSKSFCIKKIFLI